MKKILTGLVISAVLAATASADMARVEMGAGTWLQTPNGGGSTSDTSGVLSLSGEYKSEKQSSDEFYFWMLIKHPVPIVPNLRLEYVSIADEGLTTGIVNSIPVTDAATRIDMKQYDIIGYYNILDNTGWVTIDLGLDLKIVQSSADVNEVGILNYSSSDSVVIPLLYVRTRAEIPATNIGFEADVKYITDGDSTVYDIRAKVDYTLDFVPIVQPALELGYRIQKYDVDDSDTQMALDYSGVYAGVMIRF